MEMPGYLDYQKMAMQDPMAYGQSMDQLGLAKMFQAQKQREAELKNQQSAEMNPMLLQEQGLKNTGYGLDNIGKGQINEDRDMTLNARKITYPQEIRSKIEKFAIEADENQLKTIEQKIQLGYLSGDPQRIAQAKEAEQMLKSVREAKLAHTRKMEEVGAKEAGDDRRNAATNATQLEIAKLKANKAGNSGLTVIQQLGKMKVPERLGTIKAILESGINPSTQEALTDIEKVFFETMYTQDAATTDARTGAAQAGKLDMNAATGMKTNPVPSVRLPDNIAPKATSPTAFKPQDRQALDWANANPNDPRAKEIKKRLGVN